MVSVFSTRVTQTQEEYLLCKIHDFEALGADNGQFVLEEVHTERLGGDEEILVVAEPFASLTEE